MRVGPTFFVRVLVAAEYEQRHISSLRNLHRFRNQFLIFRRIAQMSEVGEPPATFFRYLATFGIRKFDSVTNLVLYSLKHTDAASGFIAVTTEMHLCRVWANHRDRLQ